MMNEPAEATFKTNRIKPHPTRARRMKANVPRQGKDMEKQLIGWTVDNQSHCKWLILIAMVTMLGSTDTSYSTR